MARTATESGSRGAIEYPLFHEPGWKDPVLGLAIPRRVEWESQADYLVRVHDWRRGIRVYAAERKRHRDIVLECCRRSFTYFCLTFLDTFVVVEVDAEGRRKATQGANKLPFCLWPMQDGMVSAIEESIRDGLPLFIDKSREIGATWVVLAYFFWLWRFHANSELLVMSKSEDDVDQQRALSTLFGKLMFMLERLPPWMWPEYEIAHMRLVNKENGSTILGAATGANVGKSRRFKAVLIDEAAVVPHFAKLVEAMNDATATPIYVTTPYGPGACRDLRYSGIRVFSAGYWNHPAKGAGRKLVDDPVFGRFWWSPFFQAERDKGRTVTDLAANLLADWSAAASMVMDARDLSRQQEMYVQPVKPTEVAPGITRFRLEVEDAEHPDEIDRAIFDREISRIKLVPDKDGPWRMWCKTYYSRESKSYRPAQDRIYVAGADVAWGRGSSNSTVCVLDGTTGDQVAEFEDSHCTPEEFATQLALAGFWFGGQERMMLLNWESNGPGQGVGDNLTELAYPWLYVHTEGNKRKRTEDNKQGWHSNPVRKKADFGKLRNAIGADRVLLRSPKAIKDLGKLVWTAVGGVDHGDLIGDESGARGTHADHATAILTAYLALLRAPEIRPGTLILAENSGARLLEDDEEEDDDRRRR